LARQVGVSFQQLQKYERGSNRVSASKLFDISEVLCVDIAVMFDGLRTEASRAENPLLVRISADEELRRLVSLYERLPSDDERRRLVRAFETFAGPAR
jgi:transcriptional regulator with XRE-family HTH domain